MPRSDPTRSNYCATRHLLRHLENPAQLRLNPLARDLFAAGDNRAALHAIADRVNRALRAMDQCERDRRRTARHSAILLRVDVRRHPPAKVAADLALSVRQFHRERRAAHERFLAAYRAHRTAVVATASAVDVTDGLLARAASLADSGETASAQAILDDVARDGNDAAKCEALVRLAGIEAWAHRLDRARAHLRAAGIVLAGETLAPARRDDLQDAGDALALSLHWFADGPSAVAGYAEKLLAQHHEAGDFGAGDRVALVCAAAALRSGEAAAASRIVRRLETAPMSAQRSPETAVDLLVLQAELADFTAENQSLSERLFERAAALARAHALGGRALYADHQLHLTRWMHTRDPRDRSAYRRLVDRVDRSLSPRLRSYLAFSAADIELAIGQPSRALALSEAAASVSTNPYETLSATGLAAGALLRLGRVDDAGAQARFASEVARSSGHARIVSLAQRINAQAFFVQGNRRAARTAIEESIECARHFSSAHVLATARAVLARIRA